MDRHSAQRLDNPDEQRPGDTAISASQLRHDFGDLHVLGPIDLEVPTGQFVAVLGPSGCGKSTLLRAIAGLLTPTSGELTNNTRRAGFVFQDSHLLPWRSVLDNVRLPAELEGTDATDQAHALLREVGLAGFESAYPNELSGGMRMRVSLARALVTTPDLLLLDEPFAALDEITRQELDDMLLRLWRDHAMTALFVTHSVAEATYLAERAVVMSRRPGRIVLDTPIGFEGERVPGLRGTPAFAEQSAALFEALIPDDEGAA